VSLYLSKKKRENIIKQVLTQIKIDCERDEWVMEYEDRKLHSER
jgi:hypothetical protein